MSRFRATVDALYFRDRTYNSARWGEIYCRQTASLWGRKHGHRHLTILVGTMTGTSEMVAQEVQQALETAGHQATIQVMDNLDAGVFQPGGIFLICTSTYGAGDVPDNAQALFNSLETQKPDLSNVTYGVIALGDRTYKDTFCQGGIRFDKLLTQLGARRAGDILMHDASSGTLPEELAAQWIVPWVEQHLAPSSEMA